MLLMQRPCQDNHKKEATKIIREFRGLSKTTDRQMEVDLWVFLDAAHQRNHKEKANQVAAIRIAIISMEKVVVQLKMAALLGIVLKHMWLPQNHSMELMTTAIDSIYTMNINACKIIAKYN